MVRRPIDPTDWIPAAVAGLVAFALFLVAIVGHAHLFFLQMAFCSAVVSVAMSALAVRQWDGRSYWNSRGRRRQIR